MSPIASEIQELEIALENKNENKKTEYENNDGCSVSTLIHTQLLILNRFLMHHIAVQTSATASHLSVFVYALTSYFLLFSPCFFFFVSSTIRLQTSSSITHLYPGGELKRVRSTLAGLDLTAMHTCRSESITNQIISSCSNF